jgi:hypothetical protein
MRRAILIALLAVAGTIAAWQVFRPRPPALVESLRALPEVARVDYVGPANAPLVVVHLRDWHFVPRELCKLDGIDFEDNLATVEKVQEDQLAIARFLIREHGVKAIHKEGISESSLEDLALLLVVLKDLDRLQAAGGMDDEARRHQRELTLELGIPGRLFRSDEIGKVVPLEDEKANNEARPIHGWGGIRFDAAKLEARRKAIVARLPEKGMALVVLGGSHDLGPYLGADVLYVRITPKSYPGDE